MPRRLTYRIRRSQSGKPPRTVYRLTVPPQLAGKLPPELEFVPEITDDGLLYRPAPVAEEPEAELPDWARPSQAS